jgi:hypothetical protein
MGVPTVASAQLLATPLPHPEGHFRIWVVLLRQATQTSSLRP